VLATPSSWARGDDFIGASAVLPDLGDTTVGDLVRLHGASQGIVA
jgi:hypothetical protein